MDKLKFSKTDSRRTVMALAVDIDGTITLNGFGKIHLKALEKLRNLKNNGHHVIFVTGRSSVEAYLLSIFGGLTLLAKYR